MHNYYLLIPNAKLLTPWLILYLNLKLCKTYHLSQHFNEIFRFDVYSNFWMKQFSIMNCIAFLHQIILISIITMTGFSIILLSIHIKNFILQKMSRLRLDCKTRIWQPANNEEGIMNSTLSFGINIRDSGVIEWFGWRRSQTTLSRRVQKPQVITNRLVVLLASGQYSLLYTNLLNICCKSRVWVKKKSESFTWERPHIPMRKLPYLAPFKKKRHWQDPDQYFYFE